MQLMWIFEQGCFTGTADLEFFRRCLWWVYGFTHVEVRARVPVCVCVRARFVLLGAAKHARVLLQNTSSDVTCAPNA